MTEPEEPKLIIDEDWKTQVQREKEQLKTTPSPQDQAAEKNSSGEALPQPPEASFPLLVHTLATQAMAALGQIPDEHGNPLPVSFEYAKHFIDMLGMVEEKTKGNLSDDESSFLSEALHGLRLVFVAARNKQ